MSDASVEQLLETLRKSYLEELPSKIEDIESEVLELTQTEHHDELYRLVHSMKGTAGSHDFHIVTSICHYFEDTVVSLMKADELYTPNGVARLLEYVDLLKSTTAELQDNHNPEEHVNRVLEKMASSRDVIQYEVLVVEPSPLYSKLIEMNFDSDNVNLTIVRDGLRALENLLHRKYDLLITSLQTSLLSADALLSAIRIDHGKNRDIPAILITSSDHGKIASKELFTRIFDRSAVKDGKLKKLLETRGIL